MPGEKDYSHQRARLEAHQMQRLLETGQVPDYAKAAGRIEFEAGRLPDIRKCVPDLARSIEAAHQEAGATGGGHDFLHAVRVAHYAFRIADNWETAVLSGIAGLCHNADRLLQHSLQTRHRKEIPQEHIRMGKRSSGKNSFPQSSRVG